MRRIALLAALTCGACTFNTDGVGVGNSGERVLRLDASGERRPGFDATVDTTAPDGPRQDRQRPDGPRPDGPRRDTTVDRGIVRDTTVDSTARDTTVDRLARDVTVDTLAPDTSIDTSVDQGGPIVYVNESFASGFGVAAPQAGNWSVFGGRARQTNIIDNGRTLSALMSVADYTVETVVRVHAIQNNSGATEGAGITARLQGPPDSNGNPARQYVCVITVDAKRLYIYEATGSPLVSFRQGSQTLNLQLNTPYRLRFTVQGRRLTCALPDMGVVITYTDNSNVITGAGRAGVVTLLANASFEYLLVTAPSPP